MQFVLLYMIYICTFAVSSNVKKKKNYSESFCYTPYHSQSLAILKKNKKNSSRDLLCILMTVVFGRSQQFSAL